MSTKRIVQLGKNYIAAEDIQHVIYDSDEENSSEILPEEQAKTRETYNWKSLKTDLSPNTEIKSSKYCGRLYDSLDVWYGKPIRNKLNSSGSNINEKKFILDFLDSNTEGASSIDIKNSEGKIGDRLLDINETEGNKECIFLDAREESLRGLTEDNICLLTSRRKRILNQDLADINFTKKFKTEIDKNMSDVPNYNSLQVELELDNNCRNEVNKRRNAKTIIDELELLNRKLKESVGKYNMPIVWGTPIVKQSSEKWDTHYIPQIIIERYQKHLEMSPSPSSSFQLKNFETNPESCDSHENQIVEAKRNRNPEKVDEEACEVIRFNELPISDIQMDEIFTRLDPEVQGIASLKNRNVNRQQKERISINSTGDSFITVKPSKKLPSKSNKGKKCNKITMAEPERCNDPTSKYQNEDNLDSNKNFEKYKMEDLESTVISPNSVETLSEEKVSAGTTRIIEEEQVVCPICDNKFDIERIVTHASHCANETYRD